MSFIYDGHCVVTKDHRVRCNHCDFSGGPYKNAGVANRMASNHVVMVHRDLVPQKPAKVKRRYTKRQPVAEAPTSSPRKLRAEVNFCPGCGCNLHAVSVAMRISS